MSKKRFITHVTMVERSLFQQSLTCRGDFFDDFLAAGFRYFDICAGIDQVSLGGEAVAHYRCRMLAPVSFTAERQVVCRTYAPGAGFANETEVLRMVVLVFGYDIENHSSELLLDLGRVLRQEARQMQQIPVIHRKFIQ